MIFSSLSILRNLYIILFRYKFIHLNISWMGIYSVLMKKLFKLKKIRKNNCFIDNKSKENCSFYAAAQKQFFSQ